MREWRWRASFAIAVAGMIGCGASAPSQRATTLTSLREAMQWVRAGHAGQPRALDSLPPLDALAGVTRDELTRQIGAPRTCGFPVEAPCARPGEVLWTFYRGHFADEIAGPVLLVELDQAGIVRAARWRRGDLEAPRGTIEPSSAGGEAIAAVEIASPDSEPAEEIASPDSEPAIASLETAARSIQGRAATTDGAGERPETRESPETADSLREIPETAPSLRQRAETAESLRDAETADPSVESVPAPDRAESTPNDEGAGASVP